MPKQIEILENQSLYDPVLRTINANNYISQKESGVRWSHAGNYATFASAFDGVPQVTITPYVGAGSSMGTTPYTVAVSRVVAGSFKHHSHDINKQFRYHARYFDSNTDVAP